MKTIALFLSVLAIVGCGGQSQTRAAFESDHPYAKPFAVHNLPAGAPHGMATIVVYRDKVPTIGFDGSNYRLVPTQWTISYDAAGNVVSREKQTER